MDGKDCMRDELQVRSEGERELGKNQQCTDSKSRGCPTRWALPSFMAGEMQPALQEENLIFQATSQL